MDISILLLTLRHWRNNSFDVRFKCDDADILKQITDEIPGTWHYKKPTWAYKTVKDPFPDDVKLKRTPTEQQMAITNTALAFLKHYIFAKQDTCGKFIVVKIAIEDKEQLTLPQIMSLKVLDRFIIQEDNHANSKT